MRKHVPFLILVTGLLDIIAAASLAHHTDISRHTFGQRANLNDVFGTWNELDPPSQPSTRDAQQDPAPPTRTPESNPKPTAFDFFGTALPTEFGIKKESSSTAAEATTTSPGQATYSIIGSLPPLPTSPIKPSPSGGQKSSAAPTSSASAPSGTVAAAASSPDGGGGNSQWKIIGVAVIAFSAVAAILLLAVFFDQWWRFVRDFMGRRKARDQVEEIVPDWEKASWEVRFGDDRHRYPSFTSAPDGASTPGLTRGRSIRSETHWKERAAGGILQSPLASSSGPPPSPKAVNRGPRTPPPPAGYAKHSDEAPYTNPFEPPPRSPAAPLDVYGGIE